MAYVKQVWANGAAGGTPISAARLSHMEDGLFALSIGNAVNLRDYLTGTTITGAQYQQAINDTHAVGKALYHPGGLIANLGTGLSAVTLDIPNDSVIFGDGSTSLIQSAASGHAISAFTSYAFMRNSGWASGGYLTTANPTFNVLISGLRFQRTNNMIGDEGPYDAAVAIRYATRNVVIDNCVFEGSSSGVVMEGGVDFTIRNSRSYSASDTAFRIVGGNGTTTGSAYCTSGIVENCWAIDSGYLLDGVSTPPSPVGPLGSAFIYHQAGARIVNCGSVNSRYNAIETGAAIHGLTINGFKVFVNQPGRIGNILIADIGHVQVSNVDFELHNGGLGTIYLAGTIGTSGNTIGQSDITINRIYGYNDYTAAGFVATLVTMGGDCSNVSIRNIQARGMRAVLSLPTATSTGNSIDGIDVRQSGQAGVYVSGGLKWTIRNCKVFDCGTDTTQPDSVRVGMVFDSLGAGGLVTDNRSEGSQYAYYVNTGTISWDRNFGSGAVAAILKTGSPTLSTPTFVS